MKKFVRTRGVPTPAPAASAPSKLHGHYGADGAGLGDQGSTLTRWCGAGSDTRASAGLWEDPEFPPSASSLGDRRLAARVVWRRPPELCQRPRFLGDDALETSTDQLPEPELDERAVARWRGEAGDAALAAAAAALALTPRLLARAVQPHSFRAAYTGRFRFRFWVFGEWVEVAVDDRLPTRAGHALCRSAARDDYTLPLLEKAYAKLHGSYAALRGGDGCGLARALQALSGGVLQSFAPPRQPRAMLLRVLHAALPRATLLVATARSDKYCAGAKRQGDVVPVPGQAYCVTGLAHAREPPAADGEGALVRLRAPTSSGGTRDRESGSFWMSFGEFVRSFARLELVHVGPDDWLREPALRARRPWRAVLARRRWRRGHSAGGPPRCPTAHANPQFRVQVPAGGAVHAVVSLTQRYVPGARTRLRAVGLAVYELPPAAPRRAALAADTLRDLRALDVTHESRAREVVTFFTLPPGQYLVVPYVSRPHVEGAFLLRILTDDLTDIWEVNDDNAIVRDIAAEFRDDGFPMPERMRRAIEKLRRTERAEEVDAEGLRALLRRSWRALLPAPPSRELCRALVALRDPAVSGRMPLRDLSPLLALLAFWRAAITRAARGGCGRLSAYGLRALLWACGVSASNKVLECVVLRHARGAELAPLDAAVALARLHLAHERYRSLDAKMKSNPLSLEEMILMTIYS